ncbi:MAG: DUF2125 domain-containing protein [Brevundimonas sp.]|uniref:DUF2125 domain-containing protein n=1 Tax=Brevundimonas sp. TaxID=1871086 RepID=UPI0025BC940D|nr:DUF2125 domain-containing protein [Brevundimonas sp.]MBX3476782.1 DUF2125 domain-containing protein [Brevundimonas sp.]
MTDTPAPRHRRRGLFAPLILVLLALAAWTGWWFWLSSQIEGRLQAQAQALRAQGWQVDYVSGGLTGWPFRTRLALDHVKIVAPSGHALAAPQLVAEANAYNPDKWVILATDGLVLTRADKGQVAVRGQALRMSVHGLNQRWPNVAIDLNQPEFTPHPGSEAFPLRRAEELAFYLRPHRTDAAPAPDSVDVLFRLVDAEGRDRGPVEGLAQGGRLTLQMEAVIEQAGRLRGMDEAGVFSAWTRAGGRFTQVRGRAVAGDSRAELSSDSLAAGPDGRLVGQVALKTERPLPAIAGLAGSGQGAVNRVGVAGAAAATAATGGQGDMDLTLVFRDGRTFLGPFALAPAPRLF